MPTYEYRCAACNYEFERFQSMSAEPVKKCPQCGKLKVKRLLGIGAGLIFKGSGFYITDYRDSSYKEKAKADAGTSGGEAKSGESKSGDGGGGESKPATPAGGESRPAAKAEAPKAESPRSDTSKAKGKGGKK